MAAYIIVDIEVLDPAGYEEYKSLAPDSIEKFQGRYLVRGGAVQTLEGEWPVKRLVILEFPDSGRAKAWWNSEEYRPARNLRQRTAQARMILVDGHAGGPGRKN
jgi:uncharacterized protein (DUF1330 family)